MVYPDIKVLDTRYGSIHSPVWPDDLIVRALEKHGEWAESETRLLSSFINPGENFWDVGAFLGTFSLSIARHVALGRLLAVEANPELGPMINSNFKRNLECEYVVAECGVAETAGWLTPHAQDIGGNHGALSWSAGTDSAAGAIACLTLAQLREMHGDYDVLKLDVEGMELDALKGDWPYIKARCPVIWAECNEDTRSIDLLGMLWWMGYKVHYFAFPAFRAENFLQNTDLIYPNAYEAALLALPDDRADCLTTDIIGSDIIYRPILTTFDLRRALFDTPRWSTPEWDGKSKAELIALLCRTSTKQNLVDFLQHPLGI